MTTIDYSKYEGHTPQPWLPCDDGDSWNILAEVVDGPGHGTFAIAEISGPSFLTYCGGKPSANAALIADAPALLARVAALEVERDRLRADRDHLHRVMGRLVYFHETNDTANSDPWVDAKMALAGKHLPAIRAALAGGAA